jgi:hypothetical protein
MVCPSWVVSAMRERAAQLDALIVAAVSVDRIAAAGKMANASVFRCILATTYITGRASI